MCGRYTLCHFEHLRQMAEEAGLTYDETTMTALEYRPKWDLVRRRRYNIAPSQDVAAVFNDAPQALGFAKWGLIPTWAKDPKIGNSLTNARAETVDTKPAYRTAFKKRRCMVPADGFYEWKKMPWGKQPFRFTMKDDALFYFAGLWETWRDPEGQDQRTLTLITTEPNAVTQPVHDRMPVILPAEKWTAWMAKETSVQDLKAMLVPYAAEAMKATPVSSAVNSARNEGAELIKPVTVNPVDVGTRNSGVGETGELFS